MLAKLFFSESTIVTIPITCRRLPEFKAIREKRGNSDSGGKDYAGKLYRRAGQHADYGR